MEYFKQHTFYFYFTFLLTIAINRITFRLLTRKFGACENCL